MYSRPTFWLEFRLLSDGLQTNAVHAMPLTAWHKKNTPVFSLFPALPTELRLKVWEYLIAPRIVGIACLCLDDGTSSVEVQRDEIWGPHPAIKPAVPVLLHIDRETRALALRHYELSFEWKVPRVLAGADMHPPAPSRSPILAPPPVMPESPAAGSSRPTNDSSLSHISSYHDLLDPSPPSSTSGVGGERRTGAEAVYNSTTTTATNGGTTTAIGKGTSTIFSPERRTSSPPRTWFNFALDAVYLLGELEPCDSFGFNSPMTYFIPSQTARRVRKAAVSFSALRYGGTGGQQIFGALFHVVDRFPPSSDDGEVLVCVTERDEWTHAMMGYGTPLVDEGDRRRRSRHHRRLLEARTNNNDNVDAAVGREIGVGAVTAQRLPADDDEAEGGNVVQKIWRDWYRGAIVTSPLKNLRFSLIPESDLEHHVYDFMMATPAKPRPRGNKRDISTAER
ncbi:hypothetical protein FHL15_006815 [Xylaria flabelliformis]|uniref:2EXR domain-containing protein n=1 Tax=Xylaria flabelliformis TaxID=2512241 RepID=A0A553HW87_9PEZI|nr:hypothetical protein FHL15_006815 [Xylaria flabelliformis]